MRELDSVALAHDIPEEGLEEGDIGAVVVVYPSGREFEVEFVTDDAMTVALLTLSDDDLKPVCADEIDRRRWDDGARIAHVKRISAPSQSA
jgi:hypothetical protein